MYQQRPKWKKCSPEPYKLTILFWHKLSYIAAYFVRCMKCWFLTYTQIVPSGRAGKALGLDASLNKERVNVVHNYAESGEWGMV